MNQILNEPTQHSAVCHINVPTDNDGQRLDNFLLSRLKGVPKSVIYRIIRKGEVRVNKGRAKPDTRLQAGDDLRIPPIRVAQRDEAIAPKYWVERLLSSIIHEDANVMVLDKPSGIAVHRGSGLETGVIECLRAARTELPFLELVHRLDRDTSGCLLLAKTGAALRSLQKITMDKRYLCLVAGHWDFGTIEVNAPLNDQHRIGGERHVIVAAEGKPACTIFKPVHHAKGGTLLEAQLLTGRTHQIRVHAAHKGHAVAGDTRYGNATFNQRLAEIGMQRLFLHAHSLIFDLGGRDYAFSSALPEELSECISALS